LTAMFSQSLADRVHELERDLRDTRGRLRKAVKSRDLWKHRYRVAASAARGLNSSTTNQKATDPYGEDLDSHTAARVS
jgi:hypothetical protein